jgi:hypothetical protein
MNIPELDELLKHHRPGMSKFQLERFVIAREGLTAWGRYQQALRELATRVDSLKRDYIALKRAEVPRSDPIDAEEAALNADTIRRTIAHRENEAQVCLAIVEELRPQFEGEIDEDALDAERWEAKIRAIAATDLFTTGRIAGTTVDLARFLPAPHRNRLLAAMEKPTQLAAAELGSLPCL